MCCLDGQEFAGEIRQDKVKDTGSLGGISMTRANLNRYAVCMPVSQDTKADTVLVTKELDRFHFQCCMKKSCGEAIVALSAFGLAIEPCVELHQKCRARSWSFPIQLKI